MRSGRFVAWLAVAALAVSLLTMTAMLGVRIVAAGRLQEMATAMRDLAGESLETTITVRQTMPLDAEIRIARPTEIDLALQVADKLPIRLDVKVEKSIAVPLDLQIDERIDIESAVTIPEKSNIRVRADIGVDQPVKWRVAHPISPRLNIKGLVPVDQEMEIDFPEKLQIKGQVPVKFRLQKELIVPVAFDVPVDQMIDLKLAIEQRARVGFPEPLRITGDIPVVMEIPVRIPLQPTPVGKYLEKMAGQLDLLLGW
jgi:hypothetical protein